MLPGVLTLAWALLIGVVGPIVGMIAGTIGSEGVSGPDPRLGAFDAYVEWQLAVFLAVVALFIAAAFRPWWRRAIALTAWGILLLDVGCLFLIAVVYPE